MIVAIIMIRIIKGFDKCKKLLNSQYKKREYEVSKIIIFLPHVSL